MKKRDSVFVLAVLCGVIVTAHTQQQRQFQYPPQVQSEQQEAHEPHPRLRESQQHQLEPSSTTQAEDKKKQTQQQKQTPSREPFRLNWAPFAHRKSRWYQDNQNQRQNQHQNQEQSQEQSRPCGYNPAQNEIGNNHARPSLTDTNEAVVHCVARLGITLKEAIEALKAYLNPILGNLIKKEGQSLKHRRVVKKITAQQPEGTNGVRGAKY
ncbi:putative uncharacterized protein DDB_G0279653 [Varroa jacobsoni]|uniref:putative uncharacterized protein DDB_G0279653 n=1 Tax=Varroa jacobsoni TaxID=62625 RepID=UPI000BF732DC|nr:putative uncharacterized protein DDB_G0279653 [Varroa jacobsoni]